MSVFTIAFVLGTASMAVEVREPAPEIPRRELPAEPRHQQDFTAYTLGAKQWRVGLFNLDYGLLDNLSVGTSPLSYLLGPNGRAKVTAVRLKRIDLGLQGSLLWVYPPILDALVGEKADASLTIATIGWRGSWIVSRKFSLHGGNTWILTNLRGSLSGDEIGEALRVATGADLSADLAEAFGDDVYAGARADLRLAQSNLAVEWRLNRRDSLILQSNNALWVSGLLVATAGTQSEGGTQLGAGVGATVNAPLKSLPSAVSLSWQWSWKRANLRLGLPLAFRNPLSYTQAFQLYWLLGPEPPPSELPERKRKEKG